jgi:hypothetical protein
MDYHVFARMKGAAAKRLFLQKAGGKCDDASFDARRQLVGLVHRVPRHCCRASVVFGSELMRLKWPSTRDHVSSFYLMPFYGAQIRWWDFGIIRHVVKKNQLRD